MNINTEESENTIALNQVSRETIWILRDYLNEKITEQGKTPEPYTYLIGDRKNYWF